MRSFESCEHGWTSSYAMLNLCKAAVVPCVPRNPKKTLNHGGVLLEDEVFEWFCHAYINAVHTLVCADLKTDFFCFWWLFLSEKTVRMTSVIFLGRMCPSFWLEPATETPKEVLVEWGMFHPTWPELIWHVFFGNGIMYFVCWRWY